MNTKEFHSLLHGSVQSGVSYIWDKEASRCQYFPTNDSESVASYVAQNGNRTLYFGLAPAKTVLPAGKRASSETVAWLTTLAVDIDVDESEHPNAAKPLPKSKSEALSWLKSLQSPKPSVIVDSGKGLHAYVVLDHPLPLETDEEKATAKSLCKRYSEFIKSEGLKRGWRFDEVGDLPRMMSIPGSFNHKGTEPIPVRVIEASGNRYSYQDLKSQIPVIASPEPLKATSSFQFKSSSQKNFDKQADFQMVYEGCAFVRWSTDNQSDVNEPSWHALISIVARCEDGEQLIHEVSKDHPGYSPEKTEAKANYNLENVSGPMRCTTIAEKTGFEGCQTCPLFFAKKLSSPIVLGLLKEKGLPSLLGKWAYDLSTDEYVEVAA